MIKKRDNMEHTSRRLISTIVLVLITTLFSIPFAIPKTDEHRSLVIRQYLADIFGVPGFKTSWYDNITDVEVAGDTVTVKTNLSRGDEKIIYLCGVVSGFVYSHLNLHLGISKVRILGSSGEVLVFRRSVLEDCPYKSSRNPGLQPPARGLQ